MERFTMRITGRRSTMGGRRRRRGHVWRRMEWQVVEEVARGDKERREDLGRKFTNPETKRRPLSGARNSRVIARFNN